MTRDDIIRLAQQTGWDFGYEMCVEHVCEFAALVAAPLEEEIKRLRFCTTEGDAAAAMEYLAHCVEKAVAAEREACAKVCDEIKCGMWEEYKKHRETRFQDACDGAEVCENAIRARGEDK